ncbi:MAG: GumC family protein [Microcystaceae cyanobacterium]
MKTLRRSLFYVLAIIGANALVWGICLAYLKVAPVRYTSEFTLIVPRANTKATTSIEGVGQVGTSSKEVFGAELSDPRSDYNYILVSGPFLEKVAKSLNISPKELGEPKTKAIDNSSLLRVEIKGKTGKDSQRKAFAIYETFTQTVERLRREEENLRAGAYERNLAQTTDDYRQSRDKLVRFQKRTGFNSPEQINLLAASIESLRQSKAEVDAEQTAIAEQLQQLSGSLGVNSGQAVQAFTLKADRLFQVSLKDYTDATNYIQIISDKWGDNHPEVLKARSRQLAARQTVEQRGSLLLGKTFNLEKLIQLNLNEGEVVSRDNLYEKLINFKAQRASLIAKSQAIQQKSIIFQQLYRQLILQRATYDELQRNVKIAEALFSSNLAASKGKDSNAFASYPLFQLLVPPSLPDEPTTPKKIFAYLGAIVGSLLVTGGIGLLWFRHTYYLRQAEVPTDHHLNESDHGSQTLPMLLASEPEKDISENTTPPLSSETSTTENGKITAETPINDPNA